MTEWFQNSTCIVWRTPSCPLSASRVFLLCASEKPNPRADIQCVQSTQGALYTCTVLPIISKTVLTRKAIGNKPTQGLLELALWDDMLSEPEYCSLLSPVLFEVLHSCCTTSLVGHSCSSRVDEVTITTRSLKKKQGVLSVKWGVESCVSG